MGSRTILHGMAKIERGECLAGGDMAPRARGLCYKAPRQVSHSRESSLRFQNTRQEMWAFSFSKQVLRPGGGISTGLTLGWCVGGRSGAPGQRTLSCCSSLRVTVGPAGCDGHGCEVEGQVWHVVCSWLTWLLEPALLCSVFGTSSQTRWLRTAGIYCLSIWVARATSVQSCWRRIALAWFWLLQFLDCDTVTFNLSVVSPCVHVFVHISSPLRPVVTLN